jgi:hypothetical protein
VSDPVGEAERFLKRFPTAKIVIILDTHSVENGAFVWSGSSPETYRTCYMLEVRARLPATHDHRLTLPR